MLGDRRERVDMHFNLEMMVYCILSFNSLLLSQINVNQNLEIWKL
jgi:hypothetical protein